MTHEVGQSDGLDDTSISDFLYRQSSPLHLLKSDTARHQE